MRILLFWVCSDRPRACETVSVTDNSIICNNATGYLEWSTIKLSVIRLSVMSYSQKNIFKNRQSKKLHVSAGEMYVMICVEFADEHFGVGLM